MIESENVFMTDTLNSLQASVDTIDSKVAGIERLMAYLQSNSSFTAHNLQKGAYEIYRAQKQLSQYTIMDDFSNEILFYIRNSDLLFSSKSTYDTGMFAERIYRFTQWESQAFNEDISKADTIMVRCSDTAYCAATEGQRILTYIWPFPLLSKNPYASIIVPVREETVREIINIDITNGYVIVFDKDEQMIMEINKPDESLINSIHNSCIGDVSYNKITCNGEKYFITRVDSSKYGWKYYYVIPQKPTFQNMQSIIIQNVTMISITTIAGFFIIYLIARNNYMPLKQLMELISKSKITPGLINNKESELDVTHKELIFLYEEHRRLSESIYNNTSDVRSALIDALLYGKIPTRDYFNKKGKSIGMLITKQYLRIVNIFLDSTIEDNNDFENRLVSLIPGDLEVYFSYDSEKQFNLVVTSETTGRESLNKMLCRFIDDIKNRYGILCRVGVSNLFTAIQNADEAYIEAVTSSDMNSERNQSAICYFEDANYSIWSSQNVKAYPHKLFEQLETVILLRDKRQIQQTIEKLCNAISRSDISLFMARCLCMQTINCVMKTSIIIKLPQPIEWHQYDWFIISKVLNTKEFIMIIEEISSELCEKLPVISSPAIELENVLTYIHDHAYDSNFSIKTMAIEIGMSDSNLSHFFKQRIGRNISDYVNDLRIQKAKEYLCTTDMPVKEIVIKVGYYDVSSFIRKFKQLAGVTPGDFRKKKGTIAE